MRYHLTARCKLVGLGAKNGGAASAAVVIASCVELAAQAECNAAHLMRSWDSSWLCECKVAEAADFGSRALQIEMKRPKAEIDNHLVGFGACFPILKIIHSCWAGCTTMALKYQNCARAPPDSG